MDDLLPDARSPSEPLPEGTVTVLFSDVEGSTDLRTRMGDDVAQAVMRTHESLLRDQLTKFGGREVVFMGDGFMVAFGSARKAIECAVGIQRCFEDHNSSGPDHQIKVRIGLNTGEVLRESGTLYGTAVNAAARISAKASGGQILVSQVTKDLTTGVRDFTFLDRGLYALKGFPAQWRLFEVAWREQAAAPSTHPAPPKAARAGPSRVLEEMYPRPDHGPMVGRVAERAAIERELDAVLGGTIRVFAVQGEAGIGKTRLIEHAVDAAAAKGFGTVIVGGDEELRGPFFLLRTLLTSTSIQHLADEAMAREPLERARDVLWGRAQAETGLSPGEQMLRVYDVATVAIRTIADARPLALLFDDLQWADEDSLKLVRYLVRTSATSPIFIMLAQRPDAVSGGVGSATMLFADLERMGLAKRALLERLSRAETGELLGNLLGTPVSPECAAALHARGEGVPFFIVEFARAFRDAGLMQEVSGRMELSAAARSTVAPNVQILIERRLAQLPDDARQLLSDAAVLGRRFRLGELAEVIGGVSGDLPVPQAVLVDRLEPAVEASLLVQLPEGSSYDYGFTHDEIRSALIGREQRQRRRAIHAALARVLERGVGTPATCLATLSFHFLEGGEYEEGVRYSIQAARDSLRTFAPEEALRAVDAARQSAQSPSDRAELLCLRDEALEALDRPEDRLSTLSEMSAFARALGDEALELEATLRRASATRQSGDFEQASELAREARETAQGRGDLRGTLRACIELGQARLQRPLGESFSPESSEVDVEGAAEAFDQALPIAAALGDDLSWAAIRREQGVITIGKVRAAVLELLADDPDMFMDPLADPRQVPAIGEGFERSRAILGEAVEAYEKLGDQRGLMSTLIAMAYANIIEETRHGHAGRVEQIRLLRRNLRRLTSESERAESDAYMLFGIHVYARTHAPVDLALKRGVEAYEAARALGNRSLELLAAGGIGLTYLMFDEIADASAWLDKAGAAAIASADVLPERQLETWRGQVRAAAGDGAGMRRHLERALALASERGSPAGRSEVLALLGIEGARLGADQKDDELLEKAAAWGEDAIRMARALPPSDAWFEAYGYAALAQVALARGDRDAAFENGLAAIAEIRRTRQFFTFLFPELRLLIARATAGFEDPRVAEFVMQTRGDIMTAVWQTSDDELRARWLRSRVMAELCSLVGADEALRTMPSGAAVEAGLSDDEIEILRRIMSGQTNREIARALDRDDAETAAQVERIFAALGVTTRSQASAAAVREGIV